MSKKNKNRHQKVKSSCAHNKQGKKRRSKPKAGKVAKDLNLALQHHQANQLHEAEVLYMQVLEDDPDNITANHNLGLIAHSTGHHGLAVQLINRVIAAQPHNAEAHYNLGEAWLSQGNISDAFSCFRKAVSCNPELFFAYYRLGELYDGQEKLKEAADCFKKASSLKPDFFQAHFNLANTWQRLDKLEAAVASYRQALVLNPEFVDAHNNLGIALKNQGEFDAAVCCFERATSLKGDYAEAYYNLGDTQRIMGNFNGATSSYNKVLSLDARHVGALNNLGIVSERQGKLQEAAKYYKKALAINPGYAQACYNYGNVLKEQGELADAAHAYQKALALNPDYLGAKHQLAALTGQTTETAPLQYVRDLFDQYSSKFEHHLVEVLEYQVPTLLGEELNSLTGKGVSYGRVVDLGCGSGLSGEVFAPFSKHLTGVDLSLGMLTAAKEKGIYHHLVYDDIISFLVGDTETYDLLVATDVLVYLGELESLFRLVAQRSAAESWFVFSIEGEDINDFILRPSGRYAHSKAYINFLAAKHNFVVQKCSPTTIRKEKDFGIPGSIFVLQRRVD